MQRKQHVVESEKTPTSNCREENPPVSTIPDSQNITPTVKYSRRKRYKQKKRGNSIDKRKVEGVITNMSEQEGKIIDNLIKQSTPTSRGSCLDKKAVKDRNEISKNPDDFINIDKLIADIDEISQLVLPSSQSSSSVSSLISEAPTPETPNSLITPKRGKKLKKKKSKSSTNTDMVNVDEIIANISERIDDIECEENRFIFNSEATASCELEEGLKNV